MSAREYEINEISVGFQDVDSIEVIEDLAQKMKKHRSFYQVCPITSAKVPIVKFRHRSLQVEGDISLYNTLVRHDSLKHKFIVPAKFTVVCSVCRWYVFRISKAHHCSVVQTGTLCFAGNSQHEAAVHVLSDRPEGSGHGVHHESVCQGIYTWWCVVKTKQLFHF